MTCLDLLYSSPFPPESYQPANSLRATDPEQILAPCRPANEPLRISAHACPCQEGSSPRWLTLLAFAATDPLSLDDKRAAGHLWPLCFIGSATHRCKTALGPVPVLTTPEKMLLIALASHWALTTPTPRQGELLIVTIPATAGESALVAGGSLGSRKMSITLRVLGRSGETPARIASPAEAASAP